MNRKREHAPAERSDSVIRERAEVREQLFGAAERPRVWRLEPAKSRDILNTAGFEREDDFRKIEAFHFRQFLGRAIEMFALGPKTEATPGRGATGASGALIGGSAANFFHEQSVDAAPWIEPRDPRQAAVDHDVDAIDRQ